MIGGGAAAGAGVAENTIGAADAVLPGADSGDWLLWGGLLLREQRLRVLLPLRAVKD